MLRKYIKHLLLFIRFKSSRPQILCDTAIYNSVAKIWNNYLKTSENF